MRKIICTTLFTVFFLLSSFAQQYKALIPYEMVGGKMIIEVELNGVRKRAIFDTGAAKNTITEKLMNELRLSVTSTQSVTDVNSKKVDFKKSSIAELLLPNSNLIFKGFDALMVEGNPFECLGVEVLIGSEMFAQTIVEIDHKAKTLLVTSAEVQPKNSLRSSSQFVQNGFMPIITTNLDNIAISTLFDTGYGGFFLLKNEDYFENVASLNSIAQSISEGSIGLGGKSADELSHRVLVNKMSFTVGKFYGLVSETSSSPFSLLGMKVLDYGKVIIDYSRGRLYFEPYEKEVTLPKPLNDFGLTVKDGKMLISTVWSGNASGIANGDVVTHINRRPTPVLDFCESTTIGVKELKVKQRTTLTVSTKSGIRKIKYLNKK